MGRTGLLAVALLSLACSASSGGERQAPGASGTAGAATASGGAGGNETSGGAGGTTPPDVPSSGGTSSTGAGGAQAMGGMAGMAGDPGDSVTFDWPETPPGVSCKPGHYVGVFDGVWASSLTVFPAPIPVTGNVDLYLTESMSGEFLEITDGTVSGVANLTFPYSADIEGKLDCKTGKLVNGYLKNGQYSVPPLPPIPWEGPVSADYDKLTSSLTNGTWMGSEMNPLYGGSGTWNAGFVP